jgi:hypothetical protein
MAVSLVASKLHPQICLQIRPKIRTKMHPKMRLQINPKMLPKKRLQISPQKTSMHLLTRMQHYFLGSGAVAQNGDRIRLSSWFCDSLSCGNTKSFIIAAAFPS